MSFVSEIMQQAPDRFKSPLQAMTYASLAELQIPFQRVETDETVTMEDCTPINHKLDMKMVKTLFLCNRQRTAFYLYVTTADKPFNAREFSNALGIARVSFAPAELMESMLGVTIGAATVFGVLRDTDHRVQVVVDRDVVREEWYGCSDGTTTGYMKVKTGHIVDDFLVHAGHAPSVIEVNNPATG